MLYALIGSIVFGLLLTLWLLSIAWADHGQPTLENLWVWLTPAPAIFFVLCVFTFWFGGPGGSLIAWILLRKWKKSPVRERQAIGIGGCVGAALGVIMDAIWMSLFFEPLSATGVDVVGQTNQTVMRVDPRVLFWAVIALIMTTFLGGLAGRELRKHMSGDLQGE
jgi:hypothetical protein